MSTSNDERKLKTRGVQLGRAQWDWLDARAERRFSRSAAAEIRQLVAAEMEKEERERAAAEGVAA